MENPPVDLEDYPSSPTTECAVCGDDTALITTPVKLESGPVKAVRIPACVPCVEDLAQDPSLAEEVARMVQGVETQCAPGAAGAEVVVNRDG